MSKYGSGPSKEDVANNVAGWDTVGFGSGSSSSGSSSSGSSSSGSSGGSDNDSGGRDYYTDTAGWGGGSKSGPNMARDPSRAGQTIQQGMYQISYDDLGYAKSARKTSDSAGYVVDGVTYDGNGNMVSGGGSGGQQMNQATSYQSPINALDSKNYAGGTSGSGVYGGNYSDASAYLRDMYAQQNAANLAALKSTYEQNVADSEAQDDLISSAYQRQRNQAAAQNDLQRMQMNEYGIMRGLNSGTSGQMALAQSAALQGSLAQLGTQEAQSLSDNALNRQKLTIAYQNAADQAAAEGNAQLASALYNEYVRQQELALQYQQAAQEQANWEAKMAYQQQQDALSQQNWQAQFDYQKQQDNLEYQLALQKLYGAGSSNATAQKLYSSNQPGGGYDNGGLTTEQVKVLQNYYGVTADGLWGKNSSNAAGGLTAAQAWDAFQSGPLKSIEQSVGMNRTYNGQVNAIRQAQESGQITESQAEAMLQKFGLL